MPPRTLFTVAGAANLLVAVALVVPGSPLWSMLGMAPPRETAFLQLFALLVGVFGLAYLWIARDLSGKRALIQVAVAGKLSVVTTSVVQWVAGAVPGGVPLAFAGDVVFALLFLQILRRHPG